MRRVATLGVAAAVTLAALACGRDAPPSATPAAAEPAGWNQLPPSPLGARYGAFAAWTGAEVLVIGGTDAPPCPPNADCAPPAEPAASDGAAWDPATGGWRRIADAPRPVVWAQGAVAGDSLYLLVADALLRYHLGADRWELLEPPPGEPSMFRLTAMGSELLAYQSSQEFGVQPDFVLEPESASWSPVPIDPLAAAYDRTAVWTGREIVLLAIPLEARAPNQPPLVAAAILDPATLAWRRLPDSTITGGAGGWGYAGDRVVNAAIGTADGGEVNNWGRPFPFGGMLGQAGVWAALPDPPAEPGAFTGVAAAAGEYALADGWALHVPTGAWTRIPSPGVQPTDAATVWTGDQLITWGGVHWNGAEPTILGDGFAWRP